MKNQWLISAFALSVLMGCAANAAAPAAPYDPPALFDGMRETSEYVQSFDGTRIAVSVRRPTKNGQVTDEKWPVIVTQDRSMSGTDAAKRIRYFTDRGYVWVAQDRRGTGASFGKQTGFVNDFDAKDAKAVIEWAGAQAFSNGKVVAFGCSNQGAWQYVTAALDPKYLVAIVPACSSPQFFDHAVTLNGVPIFQAAAKHYSGECAQQPSGGAPSGGGARPGGGFVAPPSKPVDADGDSSLLKAATEEQKCGSSMLGQYWLNMPRDGLNTFANTRPAMVDSAMTNPGKMKSSGVAILQIGGWYDAAVAGQLEGQRQWGGRVIMGPWIHSNRLGKDAKLPNADLDSNAETLRWFDFHAKGIKNGADKPAISFYTVNAREGSEWQQANQWPPVARKTSLFFTDAGLALKKPVATGLKATYPQQDVRWFDGAYQPLNRWSAGDMAKTDAQSLTHTLEPFSRDTEVTGTPTARLWISADAKDVNVFAMLEDVSPDGHSTFVTDGRLRASWRKQNKIPWGKSDQVWHRGFAEDIAPLTPGQPVEVVFDLYPISYVFKQGHQVRVSLVTSIGEAYQAPPLAEGKAVTLTLYRDGQHPSAVELPMK